MLSPGDVIERYTVERRLGEGGMATVYLVRHQTLDSLHALKVLHQGDRQRLVREGRLQSRLRHPNVVAVTDVIDVGGAMGLVMEYVDGPDLRTWMKRHPPTREQALAVFDGIREGVAQAHRLGVVHRDLKPANVLLEALPKGGWRPKVADFGIATAAGFEGGITRTGVVMGTPEYMAPEQMRGRCDHRADLYALGAILYELLHHQPAFSGATFYELVLRVGTGEHGPLDALPRPVREAVEGCLQADADRRIPDCEVLGSVLAGRSWTPPSEPRPRRDLRPLGGLLVGVGLGLALGFFTLPRAAEPVVEAVAVAPPVIEVEPVVVLPEEPEPVHPEPPTPVAPEEPAVVTLDARQPAEVVVAAGPFRFSSVLSTRCDAVEVHRLVLDAGTGLMKNLPLDRSATACELVVGVLDGTAPEVSAVVTQSGWCQVKSGDGGLSVDCT